MIPQFLRITWVLAVLWVEGIFCEDQNPNLPCDATIGEGPSLYQNAQVPYTKKKARDSSRGDDFDSGGRRNSEA